MKITKSQLKQIIKEELESTLSEVYNLPGSVYDSEGEPEIASPYRKKPKRSYGSGISSVDKPRPPQSAEDKAISMYKGVLQGYLTDPNTARRLGRPPTLEDALRAFISNSPELIQRAADELEQEMEQ
tara:strand:- start:63 stop:443 length:381 start_codon:yes stop_codon:yes gene_type:complete